MAPAWRDAPENRVSLCRRQHLHATIRMDHPRGTTLHCAPTPARKARRLKRKHAPPFGARLKLQVCRTLHSSLIPSSTKRRLKRTKTNRLKAPSFLPVTRSSAFRHPPFPADRRFKQSEFHTGEPLDENTCSGHLSLRFHRVRDGSGVDEDDRHGEQRRIPFLRNKHRAADDVGIFSDGP
jgi:hypothetical protein